MQLENLNNKLVVKDISSYYSNKGILVTGATGYLGKVLTEKLLRSCSGLNKIYLLIRHKKGKKPSERLDEIVHCKLFDEVKRLNINYKEKLQVVEGDLTLPKLGLSNEDRQILIENVNIIINSAATIRFDEPLDVAVNMNIGGAKRIAELAKELKNLESLVHVSTAYIISDTNEFLYEKIYEPEYDPQKLLNLMENSNKELVDYLTPIMVRNKPNTYIYTKKLAEALIAKECKNMPAGIFRPSIIGSSWKEPFPGWIDTFFGPTFAFCTGGTGLFRIMYGNDDCVCDLIPVDACANALIATTWYIGSRNIKTLPILNYTSGWLKKYNNEFYWGNFSGYANEAFELFPFENIQFSPNFQYTKSHLEYYYKTYILQLIPAYIMDFFMKISKRKQFFVKIQHRIHNFNNAIKHFTSHEWSFANDSMLKLIEELDEKDKITFNFDLRGINWKEYICNYSLGSKLYVMKEEKCRVPLCKKRLNKVKRVQSLIITGLILLLLKYFLFDTELGLEFIDRLYEYAISNCAFLIDFIKSYNFIDESGLDTKV